jgi:hypothetical protein
MDVCLLVTNYFALDDVRRSYYATNGVALYPNFSYDCKHLHSLESMISFDELLKNNLAYERIDDGR